MTSSTNNNTDIQPMNNTLNETIIEELSGDTNCPTINLACDSEACYVMTNEFEMAILETEE